jgi:hypothetical protein
MDVHQGALQNWQLVKNDEVFNGNEIEVTHRVHPKVGSNTERLTYDDAYEKSSTPKNLVESFLLSDNEEPAGKDLQDIHSQQLSQKLFSMAYLKIAEEFEDISKERTFDISKLLN